MGGESASERGGESGINRYMEKERDGGRKNE